MTKTDKFSIECEKADIATWENAKKIIAETPLLAKEHATIFEILDSHINKAQNRIREIKQKEKAKAKCCI